jgi:hypothetical protein
MDEPSEVKPAGKVCNACKEKLEAEPTVQLADQKMCEACRAELQSIKTAANQKGFKIGL